MSEFDHELLNAWDDPEVPEGFADRVVERMEGGGHTPPGPPAWSVYAAIAALIAVGGLAIVAPQTAAPPTGLMMEAPAPIPTPMAVLSGAVTGAPGAIQCVGPDEVEFPDGGRAFLRADAALEWSVDTSSARLKVHQRTGNVRYSFDEGEKVLLTIPGTEEAIELEGRFEVDLNVEAVEAISTW